MPSLPRLRRRSERVLRTLIALTLLAGFIVTGVRLGDDPPTASAVYTPPSSPIPGPSHGDLVEPAPEPKSKTRVLGERRSTVKLPIRGDEPQAKPRAKKKTTPPAPRPPAAAPSLEPQDFIAARASLSPATRPDLLIESAMVTMHDGVELYVEVTRPDPAKNGAGPWPVIMEISPYHGTNADRIGTRIFPDPRDADGNQIGLTGYFAPRGYAVVMVDLRGTGRSQGCLDHLGPDDAQDVKRIVEWAANQPWSNGRVGITGHSYVGSTPSLAAAMKPEGLVTIAPSAGLATMYDHQFQSGVPYSFQWIGPMEAYEQLALQRHLPPIDEVTRRNATTRSLATGFGDNFGNDMEYFGCGMRSSALTAGTGQVTGQYQGWHADRDWRQEAAEADIPIFIIHGVNDDAARIPAAEWFFGMRTPRPTDKVWIGQWTHGSGDHVNRRFDQWQYALHAWFDKHLKQMAVDTGPPVEIFLNQGVVATSPQWNAGTEELTVALDASGRSLGAEPAAPSSASFVAANDANTLVFEAAPVASETVVVGLAKLTLHASVTTSQLLHLVGTILATDGETSRPVGYCAIQPGLRNGVDTVTPVVPGQIMELHPTCFTVAHRLEAGERLQLRIGTTSPHHVTFGTVDARVTIHTGPGLSELSLRVMQQPLVYPDAPLRLDPQ